MNNPNIENLKEINLTDYLFIILKRRKFIWGIVGTAFIITTLMVFIILPRWYKSVAVVMPAKQSAQFSLSSVIKNIVPLGGLGLGGGTDQLHNYIAILESRSCMEDIIRRFNLIKRYQVENVEEAIKELTNNVSFNLTQNDVTVEIVVFDTDSVIAADIANAFVETLNDIQIQLSTQEARNNRQFLERRYSQNLQDLKQAEEALREFQKYNRIYALHEQVRIAVQTAAEIKSQALLKEIELGILRNTIHEEDPRYKKVEQDLNEINKKIQEFNVRTDTSKRYTEFFPEFEKTPDISMNYIRKVRDVEIQQKLMEILLPLYEQAKIEEQRDTPSMVILDHAVPAIKSSKPRRILTILIVTFAAVIFSLFYIFIIETILRIRKEITESENEKLKYIGSSLKWKNFFSMRTKALNSHRNED